MALLPLTHGACGEVVKCVSVKWLSLCWLQDSILCTMLDIAQGLVYLHVSGLGLGLGLGLA